MKAFYQGPDCESLANLTQWPVLPIFDLFCQLPLTTYSLMPCLMSFYLVIKSYWILLVLPMTLPSALRFYHFGQKYSITKCFLKSFPQTCDIVKTERANLLLQLTGLSELGRGGGQGDHPLQPPLDYDRPLNPTSSRVADYASHNTICPLPLPSLCVQMDFTRTFETTTKGNNINHV